MLIHRKYKNPENRWRASSWPDPDENMRTDTKCVHLPLREAAGHPTADELQPGPQQEPPCTDSHPRDSQWPNQLVPLTDKWGCILIPLEAKSTNIYAMAKLSYSWFKLTWAPDNLLEDPLVTGLLKWSLVVKNKLIKVNIFEVEEQF